jgi:hypothetical protein
VDQLLATSPQLACDRPRIFEPFEEAADPLRDATKLDPALVFGTTSRLANMAILIVVAAPLCLPIPDWLRATAIGCIWGALSLAGLRASWARRRLLSGVYALLLAQLAQQSLRGLAGLDHNAAWVLVVVVLASGWAVGLLWTPWDAERRQPMRITKASRTGHRLKRWSLWDIGCLATGVAVLSWIVPRTETPLHLVCQIAPALVGGLLVSLLAVEWACRDRWSLRRLLAVVICGPIACGLCLWLATPTAGLQSLGWQPMLRWWVAGPGSVMAAQGLTVLGYLATVRLDTHMVAKSTAAGTP